MWVRVFDPEEPSEAWLLVDFREAFVTLDRRIGLFLSLPLSSLDGLAVKKEVQNIGRQ